MGFDLILRTNPLSPLPPKMPLTTTCHRAAWRVRRVAVPPPAPLPIPGPPARRTTRYLLRAARPGASGVLHYRRANHRKRLRLKRVAQSGASSAPHSPVLPERCTTAARAAGQDGASSAPHNTIHHHEHHHWAHYHAQHRAQGLADFINQVDTLQGSNIELGLSHLPVHAFRRHPPPAEPCQSWDSNNHHGEPQETGVFLSTFADRQSQNTLPLLCAFSAITALPSAKAPTACRHRRVPALP